MQYMPAVGQHKHPMTLIEAPTMANQSDHEKVARSATVDVPQTPLESDCPCFRLIPEVGIPLRGDIPVRLTASVETDL